MKAEPRFPWLYLLVAYGWAWLWWLPVALARVDYQKSPLLVFVVLVGAFGPGLAGILLTYRSREPEQRRDFWRRALDVRRVQWRWIGVMLVLWPALHLGSNLLSAALGSPPPAFGIDFGMFVLQAVAFSFYATLCYIDNRHSTLAVVLLHTVGNLCNDVFTLPGGTLKFYVYTTMMVAGALVVAVLIKRRTQAGAATQLRLEALS